MHDVVYWRKVGNLRGPMGLLGSVGASQAEALFLSAPMIAVSMAPPAPPAITCEMMPPMLRLPDCAAAVIAVAIT